MNITLQTPQGELHMTSQLGRYSLSGVERSAHAAGQVLGNLGSAEIVAGAPNTTDNDFYQADQSVTLICDGVQPKNVSSGY